MTDYTFYVRTNYTPDSGDSSLILASYTAAAARLTKEQHDSTHMWLYNKIVYQGIENHSNFDLQGGALTDENILIYDATDSMFKNFSVTGDGSLSKAGALAISKIGGKAVSFANSFTVSGNYAVTLNVGAATNVNIPASGTLLSDALTTGYILMGVGGAATAVAITGPDITIDETGASINTGSVDDDHLAGSIAWSKLATGTASKVAVTSGGGVLTVAATTTTELAYLAGVTAGTLTASKALVVSAGGALNTLTLGSINIATTIISSTGAIELTPNAGSEVKINTGLAITAFDLDGFNLILDSDADTYIKSSVDDVVEFFVGGTSQVLLADTTFKPYDNNVITLGISGKEFKEIWVGDLKSATAMEITNAGMIITSSGDISFNLGGSGNGLSVCGLGDYLSFFGATPAAQPSAYTVTNYVETRSLSCDEPQAAAVAKTLATLISDLVSNGYLTATIT